MITLFETAVPTFTSPKSTVAGVTPREESTEAGEKEDPWPPPQPEMMAAIAATSISACTLAFVRIPLTFWGTSGRPAEIFSFKSKKQTLLNLRIGNHPNEIESVFPPVDAKSPAELAAGK